MCVLPNKTCVPVDENADVLEKIVRGLKIDVAGRSHVEAIAEKLGVNEIQLWSNRQIISIIGEEAARRIHRTYYKPEGPWNTDELLSNFMIDDILSQWKANSKRLFGKAFDTMPCPCIDFMNYNHPMRYFDPASLIGYNALGVVCNTDLHTGGGKHWICYYIDVDAKKILFFNSSSNTAPEQLLQWLVNLSLKLRSQFGLEFAYVNVVQGKPIQKSETECGMWCLMFIRSQLLGYKPEWILTATDAEMLDFRKDLFLNFKV